MTDLNKEREAFERLPLAELAIKSEYVYYNEETNSYWPNEDFCPSDAPETMNFAWEAWQEKAKAQAVPETHIVVPKQPTPKMIDATWDFDDEIIEMSSNTRNEFIWKKMVEASESGAEQ